MKERDINQYNKKFNNKTIDGVKSKINLNGKERLKVRVKNYYNIK